MKQDFSELFEEARKLEPGKGFIVKDMSDRPRSPAELVAGLNSHIPTCPNL